MARVFIPAALRSLAGGLDEVQVSAGTVREIVDQLEARYPGFRSGV
jgi:molybdopterin converting factor small subunit